MCDTQDDKELTFVNAVGWGLVGAVGGAAAGGRGAIAGALAASAAVTAASLVANSFGGIPRGRG